MKRLAIAATVVLIVLLSVTLWLVWSASAPLQGAGGLAAVSAGISEALVDTLLILLLLLLAWRGWTLGRRYWRKSRAVVDGRGKAS